MAVSSLLARSGSNLSPPYFLTLTSSPHISPIPADAGIQPGLVPYHPAYSLRCYAAWSRHRLVSWSCFRITSFNSSLRKSSLLSSSSRLVAVAHSLHFIPFIRLGDTPRKIQQGAHTSLQSRCSFCCLLLRVHPSQNSFCSSTAFSVWHFVPTPRYAADSQSPFLIFRFAWGF